MRDSVVGTAVWSSEELRQRWHEVMPDSFFKYFEALIRAVTPGESHTAAHYAARAGIDVTYVDRRRHSPVELYAQLGLITLERTADQMLQLRFDLPITVPPPANWSLRSAFSVSWLTDTRVAPPPTPTDKQRIYSLDRGICVYCGGHVPQVEAAVAHVCPLAKRGADVDENKAIAHGRCNGFALHRVPGYCDELAVRMFRNREVAKVAYAWTTRGFVPQFEFTSDHSCGDAATGRRPTAVDSHRR